MISNCQLSQYTGLALVSYVGTRQDSPYIWFSKMQMLGIVRVWGWPKPRLSNSFSSQGESTYKKHIRREMGLVFFFTDFYIFVFILCVCAHTCMHHSSCVKGQRITWQPLALCTYLERQARQQVSFPSEPCWWPCFCFIKTDSHSVAQAVLGLLM